MERISTWVGGKNTYLPGLEFFYMRTWIVGLWVAGVVLSGCQTVYQPQSIQYSDLRVTTDRAAKPSVDNFLRPYRDSMSRHMDAVIATTTTDLEKKQPEGTLGSLLADAMRAQATQKMGVPVDAAFVNFGGVRLTMIPAGPITRGKVYEIMPFDNIIGVQTLTGIQFQAFLDYVAARGGWPCSGVKFQIRNKQAVQVEVGGKPLDPQGRYQVANSDYVIQGGDNCQVLKDLPVLSTGYLLRDAILDYVQGKTIQLKLENRIQYAQ